MKVTITEKLVEIASPFSLLAVHAGDKPKLKQQSHDTGGQSNVSFDQPTTTIVYF